MRVAVRYPSTLYLPLRLSPLAREESTTTTMLDHMLLEREALRERCYADLARWFVQEAGSAGAALGPTAFQAILVRYLAGDPRDAAPGSVAVPVPIPSLLTDPLFGRPETTGMRARFLADWAELERRAATMGIPAAGRGPLILVELREKVDVMRTVMETTPLTGDLPLLAFGDALVYGDAMYDAQEYPGADTPALRRALFVFLQRVTYLRVSAQLARGLLAALFEDLIVPPAPESPAPVLPGSLPELAVPW